jgi:8-oxo-dGTP pyrophosphatase MutT (NUDIX family)
MLRWSSIWTCPQSFGDEGFAGRGPDDPLPRASLMIRLPPAYEERARAHLRGELSPATPRDAATVALVRDGDEGVEVYLLRRVAGMAFAPGMHVFPGGAVDPRDADQSVPWSGPPPPMWTASLNCAEPLVRAIVSAAARETFEESAVLLAGASSVDVVRDTTGDDWERDRAALVAGELSFATFLVRRCLLLRADLLKPWAHWITPEFEPRRYDTRFFVAPLPPGQLSRDVGGEADDVAWWPVQRAVHGHEQGHLAMLPPTAETLRELAAYSRVVDVLAADRAPRPRTPRAVPHGDELRLEWG